MRSKRQLIGIIAVFIMLSMFNILSTAAQDSVLATLTSNQTTMLNDINRYRIRENLVHLAPSTILNQVAQTYLNDLISRQISSLGDVFLLQDGSNIDDLLQQAGYGEYSDGFKVDIMPLIVREYEPTQIVDYWIAHQTETQFQSLQMLRGLQAFLPIYSPLYREIGIAYQRSESTGRSYYLFVFASQPDVLPIVVVERDNPSVIAYNVNTRDVIIYVPDENLRRFGEGDLIGAIQYLRLLEDNPPFECPDDYTNGWQPYQNENTWTLSDGFGVKTIYAQMCDDSGRPLVMSTQVVYGTVTATPVGTVELATPDVLGIANATQTAAASATAFAPYLATVEAILTATATAP